MLTDIHDSVVAQARDHGPSEHRADQLPQSHPNSETSKSEHRQKIKTAISTNEVTNKVSKANHSPCPPKTPQRDVFHSLPSPETPSVRGRGDFRSQDPLSTAYTSKISDATPKSRQIASDSAPRTPDSRGLKRKGSDLTPSSKTGVPSSGSSKAFSTELYKLSLGPPPSFNLDIPSEKRSPSGAEAQ